MSNNNGKTHFADDDTLAYISQLVQQNDKLQKDVAMLREVLTSTKLTFDYVTTTTAVDCSGPSEDISNALAATADSVKWLREHNAGITKDAERYRSIRNQSGWPIPEEFDKMVDADMSLRANELMGK